jgi:hypothetical protein
MQPQQKAVYRRSGGANTVSSLASSKGAVYMNPDGTFVYRNQYPPIALVNPAKSDTYQPRGSVNSLASNEHQQLVLPVFGDDELAFFINVAHPTVMKALRSA